MKTSKKSAKSKPAKTAPKTLAAAPALFDRVAAILDQARGNVVRAVNSQMVITYWLIGREIVHELQSGEERAAYGKRIINDLSQRLTQRFGRGFPVTNLKAFRLFFQTYAHRQPEIGHFQSAQFTDDSSTSPIRHIGSAQSGGANIQHIGCGVLADLTEAVEQVDAKRGFSPALGWTHYWALMRVENRAERLFYDYVLIDLKLGKLTHQDIGQMDGYVRLWDESGKQPEDNPTIGIILCSEKSETIPRYSVLADSQQLFASRYRLHLPTEQELAAELRREVQNLGKLDEKEGVLK